ncbi:hypothetical protein [Phyllobacterium zundukense]|uniref:hypothetical protein n=1 Tax=Phyllobacterium zundukense TaxID=1867719 RepID=UPI0012FFDC4E|nr:hypothetical protein [Phyllobacterium zundukense]
MDTYLVWALAHQQIAGRHPRKLTEDEFYTQFGFGSGSFRKWIARIKGLMLW